MSRFFAPSELRLTTGLRDGRTVLEDIYCTPPYKVAQPFPMENGGIEVMAMMASAGILDGDEYSVTLDVAPHTTLMYTTQSYEKVHPKTDLGASKKMDIAVGESATLIYVPMPTIPFAQASLTNTYTISLTHPTARLALLDIITCGRKARGEVFQFEKFQSTMKLYVQEELVLYDNVLLEPACTNLQQFGLFEEFTHQATLVMYTQKGLDIGEIRHIIAQKNGVTGGATQQKAMVVVKLLGHTAQSLYDLSLKLIEGVL